MDAVVGHERNWASHRRHKSGILHANGVGDFYAYDTWEGKPVICRFQWTIVNGNPHFEQAYSVDRGRSWETNWTTDYERVPASAKGVWDASRRPATATTGSTFSSGRGTRSTCACAVR